MFYEDVILFFKVFEGKGIYVFDLGLDWVGGLGYYGVDYYIGFSDVDLYLVNEVNIRVMFIWSK